MDGSARRGPNLHGPNLHGPNLHGAALRRPGDTAAVESYLAEVTARLPGPARAGAGIVAELRSGLLDATDAHRSAGLPAEQAARAAIGEFGDPGLVADGFRSELAARQARRVSVSLSRWLPVRPRRAPTAAVVAGFGAAAAGADIVMLSLLAA